LSAQVSLPADIPMFEVHGTRDAGVLDRSDRGWSSGRVVSRLRTWRVLRRRRPTVGRVRRVDGHSGPARSASARSTSA
jgi:hypothetical protein